MKKIILIVGICFLCSKSVFAENTIEPIEVFNNFVYLSNQYDLKMLNFYSANPIIKRDVLGKKTNTLVTVPFSEHVKIQKMYSNHKKMLEKVKNNYKNPTLTKIGNNMYKITALRCPTVMDRCFNSYIIIQKQNGEYKIFEEYSQVQSTYFLKFKDKK